jgi:signal transduction histidine kinase
MSDWITKQIPARRLTLVGMALLFITVSLVGFAALLLSPRILQALSAINYGFPKYVRLTNAVLALICAAFLLWPREGSRLVGRWNDYVGLAFFTFFIQYGARFVALELDSRYVTIISVGIVYLGSYVNNLLFLAAARILLNKNRQIYEIQTKPTEASFQERLKQEWVALRSALPDWYWKVFPVAMIPMAEPICAHFNSAPSYLLWVRFPDSLFSLYCLSWFAYAIWLSFHVRPSPWNSLRPRNQRSRSRILRVLAWLGFILVLAYGAGQLVYAANPLLGYSITNPSTERFPGGAWLRAHLQLPATDDTGKSGKEESVYRELKAIEFLDGAIFAMLFPMKSLLFLPAFILYLLSIISVNDFRAALRATTSQRNDYLSAEGILKAIGESTGADEVTIKIRLPGVIWKGGKQERVLPKTWMRASEVNSEDTSPYPLSDDDRLVRILQTEGKEIIETDEEYSAAEGQGPRSDPGPQTLALVPIKFHGGAIGALQALFRGYGKFNNGTLEQLKFMAELISPSVQDFRTVLVVDKFTQELIRTFARKTAFRKPNQTKSFVDAIVETLYDLLNPLGICLLLECGFKSARLIFPREGALHDLLKDLKITYPQILSKLESPDKLKFPIIQTESGPVRMEPDQLTAGTEKGPRDLGTLILAIPDKKDHFSRPTLAAHYLSRKMLASLTAQAILTAARSSLSVVIHQLSVELNQMNLSRDEWFERIEEAIKQAGCLWVVASVSKARPLMGRLEEVAVIDGMTDEDEENLMVAPIRSIPYSWPGSNTRHIIQLQLGAEGRLWLGVERMEFGKELNFRSPWSVFLSDLANVSNIALTRIEERERAAELRFEEEGKRLREAEDERMKIIADVNTTLMHQLINMVNNMRLSAVDFMESIDPQQLAPTDQTVVFIDNLTSKTEMMKELTCAYNRVIAGDGRESCLVAEAAPLAEKLFRFELTKQLIKTDINIPGDLAVKVPANILAMAVASIMGNAIDAIRSRGRITITAHENGNAVNCHIVNNGPCIPADIVPILFEPGAKGKEGHPGSGLYLVSRMLSHYGGEVELLYSRPSETCFAFRLPKMS